MRKRDDKNRWSAMDYYELPGCIEEAIMKMRAAPAVC